MRRRCCRCSGAASWPWRNTPILQDSGARPGSITALPRAAGAAGASAAALLSLLGRSVVALEEHPDLARRGRSALVDHRIASVSYVEAPLAAGHRQRAPYNVILFAGAVAEIPSEIEGQLAE